MNPACSVKEYEKGKLSKMKKAVTFGEIMLRLQPPSYERFLQAKSFDAVYGGGEANVAVSLSQLGAEAKFVTRLPANPLGVACRNYLRGWGVDTSDIVFGGDRIGIYFCEKGASSGPPTSFTTAPGSSAATASRADYDWERILDGASWFHFTGHHARARRRKSRHRARRLRNGQAEGRHRLLRPELPQKALDAGAGARGDGKALRLRRRAHRQRGGQRRRVRHPRARVGHRGRHPVRRGLRRRGAPAYRALRPDGGGHHAARVGFGFGQRLERDALHPAGRRISRPNTTSISSTAWAAGTASAQG